MGAPSFAAPFAPLSEGDLCLPSPAGFPLPGPLPLPGAAILPGMNPFLPDLSLATYVFGVANPPGFPGLVEVDAISDGRDCRATPGLPFGQQNCLISFSVDEFAVGLPVAIIPNVGSEGVAGMAEAAADVFIDMPPLIPAGPYPPFAIPPDNTLIFDGDGIFAPGPAAFPIMPFGLVGLGLLEPDPPSPFAGPDLGSNLDALDMEMRAPAFPVYFSLDAAFPDPLEFGPTNSASGPANGFAPGAVLITPAPGVGPLLYAPAAVLGLDLFGAGTDDLDALALAENGVGGYQPSLAPYDWLAAAPTDMLLFSVRRGSAIIGTPDSCFGIPIEEGDILTRPVIAGGPPCIFMAAENLGLATFRSTPALLPFPPNGDDLDALDYSANCDGDLVPDRFAIRYGIVPDCNANNRPDACDIALGARDCAGDGIPDVCQGIVCPADISPTPNGDCVVDINDLTVVILNWGGPGLAGDIDMNGIVDINDLTAVILGWGACP